MAFTPAFGIGAGVGVGLVRGLSFNVGYAWLLIDTPGDGETIDTDLVDKSDPFRSGVAGTLFIGFAYNIGSGK